LQTNEETPPALAPLFKVADVLEQELPKQDQLTPQTKQAAAENILANANDAKLNQYAQYLGRGGKIYVHVLDASTQYSSTETKVKTNITKKHYLDAIDISNEKFRKLDINLTVVLIWDIDGSPLTREEFQTRKADKTKRKGIPKGFDSEYNATDTYLVVDNLSYASKPNNLGIEQWAPMASGETDFSDWENFSDKNDPNVSGKSHHNNFLAYINSDQIPDITNNSDDKIKFSKDLFEINEAISNALSLAIEHESAHSKFAIYSENDAYSPSPAYDNALGGARDLKQLFTMPLYRDVKFTPRENVSSIYGHVRETIMALRPNVKHIQTKTKSNGTNVNSGYDDYMVTMLQLLHGKISEQGKSFSRKDHNTKLTQMRKERDEMLKILKSIDKNKITDEQIIAFDTIEKQIEAYADVLNLMSGRSDLGRLHITRDIERTTDYIISQSKSLFKFLFSNEN